MPSSNIAKHLTANVEKEKLKASSRSKGRTKHSFRVEQLDDGTYHMTHNQEAMGKGGATYSEMGERNSHSSSHKTLGSVHASMKNCCNGFCDYPADTLKESVKK